MDSRGRPDTPPGKLSLELRCCYHLRSWNYSPSPRSVDEWARQVGWFVFQEEADDGFEYEAGVSKAIKEAGRLCQFVRGLIALYQNP